MPDTNIQSTTESILYIEDDPSEREIYRKILVEEFGFEVAVCGGDITQAVELLHAHMPQVVLLDLTLENALAPDIIFERLREENSSLRCIVFTGNDQRMWHNRFRDKRLIIDSWTNKGNFTINELASTVKRSCALARLNYNLARMQEIVKDYEAMGELGQNFPIDVRVIVDDIAKAVSLEPVTPLTTRMSGDEETQGPIEEIHEPHITNTLINEPITQEAPTDVIEKRLTEVVKKHIAEIVESFKYYLDQQYQDPEFSVNDLHSLVTNVKYLKRYDESEFAVAHIDSGLEVLRRYFTSVLGLDPSSDYEVVMGAALDQGYFDGRAKNDPELSAIAQISMHKATISGDKQRIDYSGLVNQEWKPPA